MTTQDLPPGAESAERPTFRDTFVSVGQATLDKNREQQQLIKPVAGIVTGLMVAAAVSYFFLPVASVVFLFAAIVALAGRWLLLRQVRNDLVDMQRAKKAHSRRQQPAECAEFVRLRSTQMLRDNKMLTSHATQQIKALQAWAHEVEARD